MKLSFPGLVLILVTCSATVFASVSSHELASLQSRLAYEYAQAGQLNQALAASRRAVANGQDYAPAWRALAFVESVLALDVAAERDYRQALALAPGNGETCNNFGQFLCDRGRIDEGLQFLGQALLDPEYASLQAAYYNLGRCNRLKRQLAPAQDYLLASLRIAPGYLPALKELVALYLEQGSTRLAAFYYGRLLQYAATLGPDDLFMGIKIARENGDRVRELDFAGQLQSRYPDSKETQQLLSGT